MKAATVGTFDGLHRGHHAVLDSLKEMASAKGLRPMVVTFDRHPLETIAPDRAPLLIMSPDERDALLGRHGVEVVRLTFDESLRSVGVREWMAWLRDSHDIKAIVLGYDNTFGCDGRDMSFDEYSRIGRELGLEVTVAPRVEGCSSSAVRKAVAAGDMMKARDILGTPFSITGRVRQGRRLGRTIGIPTANLSVSKRQLLPKNGVYAAEVLYDAHKYSAIVNVGDNPTVSDAGRITIEAHLLNFDGDLYGKEIRIEFLRRIRGERKFPDLQSLQAQIREDLKAL